MFFIACTLYKVSINPNYDLFFVISFNFFPEPLPTDPVARDTVITFEVTYSNILEMFTWTFPMLGTVAITISWLHRFIVVL